MQIDQPCLKTSLTLLYGGESLAKPNEVNDYIWFDLADDMNLYGEDDEEEDDNDDEE